MHLAMICFVSFFFVLSRHLSKRKWTKWKRNKCAIFFPVKVKKNKEKKKPQKKITLIYFNKECINHGFLLQTGMGQSKTHRFVLRFDLSIFLLMHSVWWGERRCHLNETCVSFFDFSFSISSVCFGRCCCRFNVRSNIIVRRVVRCTLPIFFHRIRFVLFSSTSMTTTTINSTSIQIHTHAHIVKCMLVFLRSFLDFWFLFPFSFWPGLFFFWWDTENVNMWTKRHSSVCNVRLK